MNKYQQGKIYALRSHQTSEIYIGSTIESLSKRKAKHKCAYKRYKNGKTSYVTSFKLMEYNDCYIELIENYPCNDKNELTRREGQLIREMDCLNKRIEGRSRQEYRQDNKQKIYEKCKDYYNTNKEKIDEYQKSYQKSYYKANKQLINQKFTCECGGRYTLCHKSHHFKTKKHQTFIQSNSDL